MPADLSPAQQAEHLARRKEVWEALQNSGSTCATNRGRPKEFARDTADRTGAAKASINRDIARATAIGSDIKLVAGTSLDKGVELDALAKMPEAERRSYLDSSMSAISRRSASDSKLIRDLASPGKVLNRATAASCSAVADDRSISRSSVTPLCDSSLSTRAARLPTAVSRRIGAGRNTATVQRLLELFERPRVIQHVRRDIRNDCLKP